MDPLSVAASVVGLLNAGAFAVKHLHSVVSSARDVPRSARYMLDELTAVNAALTQLQLFLLRQRPANSSRTGMIMVEQILTTLTGCVTTYSDLESILEGLEIDCEIGTFSRVKWMYQESSISAILSRVQNHKSSLTLMLTILQW